MTKGYAQIYEGEWVEPVQTGFVHQCCDCSLVHITDFAVVDRRTDEKIPHAKVRFRLKVDRRKTAASRRKLKFSKDDD
ncbi:hypothetical protein [Bradyrhizobium pachyrhizi]|uniref:hypothetical protein n=1 Tax=Bradyrhizobium pachyrhizi TaxID=280333 RepID=UPI000AE4003A|nr:hypothetical protein [Bradyrhizobium pachyrhizi]